ncbi:MAG: hypothetical protein JNN00_15685 [Chitinophagaceae bacterium]|nr:hypothetical protein [Chitinophagaceae bacterium]
MKLFTRYGLALLIISLAVCSHKIYAASLAEPAADHPASWKDLKIKDVATWKLKDLQRVTGHTLSLKEKAAFLVYKHKMKKAAKRNPGMTVGEFMASGNAFNKIGWVFIIIAVLVLIFLVVIVTSALPH